MIYSLSFITFCVLGCFCNGALFADHWVIVANGSQLPADELLDSMENSKVLALDGAANRLKSIQYCPDCILGDFDSVQDPEYWGIAGTFSDIDENSTPYEGNFGVTIIPAKDQNYTDLEKGILYCDAAGASSIAIVQATGGRMDHTMGNLGLLKKYYRPDRNLIILTEKEQMFYLSDLEIAVEGGMGEYCAIMGFPEALMTTTGLAYNGDEYLVRLGVQESVCNTIVDSQAEIHIKGEALVILPKSSTFAVKSHASSAK